MQKPSTSDARGATHNLTAALVLVDELLQRQPLDDVSLGQRPLLVLLVGQPARVSEQRTREMATNKKKVQRTNIYEANHSKVPTKNR